MFEHQGAINAHIPKSYLYAYTFYPDISKLLWQIALDEETTVQALLAEGINAVLKKRRERIELELFDV